MKSNIVICRDIHNKKYKVEGDKLNFRPAVYGIIFQGSKILLSKLWDGYDFPGGGVKRGERLDEALKREVWEETGVRVQPDKLVDVADDFFISIESKRELHSILIWYLCKSPKNKISSKHFTEEEKKYMADAEWVDLKDVAKVKFYNGIDSVRLIKEAYKLYAK